MKYAALTGDGIYHIQCVLRSGGNQKSVAYIVSTLLPTQTTLKRNPSVVYKLNLEVTVHIVDTYSCKYRHTSKSMRSVVVDYLSVDRSSTACILGGWENECTKARRTSTQPTLTEYARPNLAFLATHHQENKPTSRGGS